MKTTAKLTGDRNQCPGCGLLFNSTHAFDMHRQGSYQKGQRTCLGAAAMAAKGMFVDRFGFWRGQHMVGRVFDSAGLEINRAIANQIAVLTKAKHNVSRGDSGDFTVSKWGYSRWCADFEELQAFAKKLGLLQ